MPDQYGNYNGTYGVPSPTPAPPASIPGPGGALVAGIAAGQNIAGKRCELLLIDHGKSIFLFL